MKGKVLKPNDFIKNGKFTTLGALTTIIFLSSCIQKYFELITNEKKIKNLTTKQN